MQNITRKRHIAYIHRTSNFRSPNKEIPRDRKCDISISQGKFQRHVSLTFIDANIFAISHVAMFICICLHLVNWRIHFQKSIKWIVWLKQRIIKKINVCTDVVWKKRYVIVPKATKWRRYQTSLTLFFLCFTEILSLIW